MPYDTKSLQGAKCNHSVIMCAMFYLPVFRRTFFSANIRSIFVLKTENNF